MTARLSIPARIRACLFDLDGVLTQTARMHAAAWQEMFDVYLAERAHRTGTTTRAFTMPDDYTRYIDGKLREDGVRSFLASRDIALPEGTPDDPPSAETVAGLAQRKNDMFLKEIAHGVDVYDTSVQFVEAVRDAGIARAVVSASKNCAAILEAGGIDHLFTVRVDGVDAQRDELKGKPAPDMFLAAAARLGVDPSDAAVFEDALAGVEAGRNGRFGWVVGVDRAGHADALTAHGADVVVDDLGALAVPA
jgi:beta-phosphoglucomutase family hydrolase